ncbi:MAG: 2-polyprenyl-3-methyl-6-methoxy-1,4-benzoquinone monooxygenase [Gammaproteobacteria bacterium]|nr:2-polyprenyl-3-methyl-6-methoxy-1,4-benzoquinone monooxygenase [Gammaproteobacteria bacterium]
MSSLADTLIVQVDKALRTLAGNPSAARENPAAAVADGALSPEQVQHAAGLMRVNHTGEICAQALYEGQALTAKDASTRNALQAAADEETDHLAWCEERLTELHSRPSVLNPAFYALSYVMGAATGLMGDKVSLGFVEATEDQVCKHLEDHLETLPEEDARSREIVKTMHEDEARHGANALDAGGEEFPEPVKRAMTLASRIMTETTYRL